MEDTMTTFSYIYMWLNLRSIKHKVRTKKLFNNYRCSRYSLCLLVKCASILLMVIATFVRHELMTFFYKFIATLFYRFYFLQHKSETPQPLPLRGPCNQIQYIEKRLSLTRRNKTVQYESSKVIKFYKITKYINMYIICTTSFEKRRSY